MSRHGKHGRLRRGPRYPKPPEPEPEPEPVRDPAELRRIWAKHGFHFHGSAGLVCPESDRFCEHRCGLAADCWEGMP